MRNTFFNNKYNLNNLIKIIKKYQNSLKYIAIMLIIIIAGLVYCVSGFGKSNKKTYELSSGIMKENETDDKAFTDLIKISTDVEQIDKYYVYICGHVNNPGVYACEPGMRYFEVIQLAGGFSSDANEAALNLAVTINDGEKIYVPGIGEELTIYETTASGGTSDVININTATKEQLMLLPGIGESRALDIIAYRQEYGYFQSIEDIMNVSGIKEAAFAKIKNRIRV